jgi:hypothetical protein
VAKRLAAHKSDKGKSRQKERFFKLANRLRESEKPAERERAKENLARITFGV